MQRRIDQVKFDEEKQPGISNLISILAKITNEEISSIEQRYVGRGYGEFKKEVANKVCELLEQIQKRFTHFNNTEMLDEIVRKGAHKAQMTAQETLARATKALGLN